MKTPNHKRQRSHPPHRSLRRTWWGPLVLAGYAACSGPAPSPDESTATTPAPELDRHQTPAAQVAVPPAVTWTPRAVVEPANPIDHRPAMHNPGGVDGDRPP